VLISNLLARDRFRIVPWTVLVAIGYACALGLLRSRIAESSGGEFFQGFKIVIGTLGVFNALLLAVALWFTFKRERQA
jgi:hypothetical protein